MRDFERSLDRAQSDNAVNPRENLRQTVVTGTSFGGVTAVRVDLGHSVTEVFTWGTDRRRELADAMRRVRAGEIGGAP